MQQKTLKKPVFIASFARTPIGSFNGMFKNISATQLGSHVIDATLARAKLSPEYFTNIQSVIMGCVLSAGLGQAPARQAMLGANLPNSIPCLTINKMCASGLQAIILGLQQIQLDQAELVIAGGLENMTQAPLLLSRKFAQDFKNSSPDYLTQIKPVLKDHLFFDGLTDAYGHELMGYYADKIAQKLNITREQQDQFAYQSLLRAQKATQNKTFTEIAPIQLNPNTLITEDEIPKNTPADLAKMSELKPVFITDGTGTITAANASKISDGAAAVLLASESALKKYNLTPIAKIIDYHTHAQAPAEYALAPTSAIQGLSQKTGIPLNKINLYEINEAFAIVVLAAQQALHLDQNQINIKGGACALGHPIGASGARLITTLISNLQLTQQKTGLATLCIGGGEAQSLILELV